jgi:hypothetical protein
VFHPGSEIGIGSGRFGVGLLFELLDCAAVRLALHRGQDLESGVFGLDLFDGCFADKAAVDKHSCEFGVFLHDFQILGQLLLVDPGLAKSDRLLASNFWYLYFQLGKDLCAIHLVILSNASLDCAIALLNFSLPVEKSCSVSPSNGPMTF